jgi:uncharacterized protein YkwD
MKTTIKTIGLTAVATLALLGCGGGSGGEGGYQAHPYDAPPISENVKAQYLNAVNQARSVGRTCGELGYFTAAAPLAWSDALYKASYEHIEDLITTNTFSHSGSGTASDWTAQVQELGRGSSVEDRAKNNGYSSDVVDENAGYGSNSLVVMMNSWLKSDGHCAGIMWSNAESLGMSQVGLYWSMELGTTN